MASKRGKPWPTAKGPPGANVSGPAWPRIEPGAIPEPGPDAARRHDVGRKPEAAAKRLVSGCLRPAWRDHGRRSLPVSAIAILDRKRQQARPLVFGPMLLSIADQADVRRLSENLHGGPSPANWPRPGFPVRSAAARSQARRMAPGRDQPGALARCADRMTMVHP